MGKIRKTDLRKINKYLEYATKPISKEKVMAAALLNISALCMGIYYMQSFIIIKSILVIGTLLLTCNILVFCIKKNSSDKKLNLYHGIYKIFFTVSFGMLFGIFLYPTMGKGAYLLALVIFVVELVTIYVIWEFTKKIIESGNFPEKRNAPIVTTSTGLALAVLVPAINNTSGFEGVFGFICFICTLEGITSVNNFMQAYCYHSLEEDEKKSVIPENAIVLVEAVGCHFCEQAKEWLEEHEVTYISRNLSEEKIRMSEIKKWHEKSGVPISRFLNIQSIPYRSMRLKEKLPVMTDEEIYEAIIDNELLMKKPLIVCKDFVLVGFKGYEWEEEFKKNK